MTGVGPTALPRAYPARFARAPFAERKGLNLLLAHSGRKGKCVGRRGNIFVGWHVFMASGVGCISELDSIRGVLRMEIIGKRTGLWIGVFVVVLMVVAVGCDGVAPTSTSVPVVPMSTVEPTVSVPTQVVATAPTEVELPGDATWILDSLEGERLVEGTFIWLKSDDDRFFGFDGCNAYGGRSEDGSPVFDTDGVFSAPIPSVNAQACNEPEGVMKQGEAYMSALWEGQSFRVDGDRLEIFDGEGEVRLSLVRKMALPGEGVELAGTAWRLLTDGETGDDFRPASMVFIDDRLTIGDTACRGYLATAHVLSEGSVRFFSTSMILSDDSCDGDARKLEGEFGDFLTWAREYAVDGDGGSRRLQMWSARGKTLTFEPLPAAVEDVGDAEWVLEAIVELDEVDPGLWFPRQGRKVFVTEVTLSFSGDGISGSAGCNSYGAEAEVSDGSIAVDAETIFNTEMYCDVEAVMEQEERYLGLLAEVTNFGIFGDGLILQTEDDEFLVFRVR